MPGGSPVHTSTVQRLIRDALSNVSQSLAEFSTATRFADLPREVVEAVQRFVYDTVGCAFGGVRTKDFEIAAGVDRELGGESQCRIIGSGRMANVTSAAFLNALAVRALDYNDIYWKQDPAHPSDIIPGVWACAELDDVDGEEVVLAIALAYELQMRLCEAARPGIHEGGWHPATLTSFASAWACSRVLGLDVPQTVNAIGIAGSSHVTLGCVARDGATPMSHLADPMATRAGAWGALLARGGCEGAGDAFCGPGGLSQSLGSEWRLESLTEGLGESWRILDCGMRAFATHALLHTPITAALEICTANELVAEEVEEVRVRTLVRAARFHSGEALESPRTSEQAKRSLPFCIATALAHGRVTPELFRGESLEDPRITRNLNRITVTPESDFEQAFPELQPCHVTIVARGGQSFEAQLDLPLGHKRHPMTQDQMDTKFDGMCGPEVPEAQRQEIREALGQLPTIPARRFMELLAFRG